MNRFTRDTTEIEADPSREQHINRQCVPFKIIEPAPLGFPARSDTPSSLVQPHVPWHSPSMATITELERLALDLPQNQRAQLAARLLSTLPAILSDEDEGVAEAVLRDAEMDANPVLGISLDELDREIEGRKS